MYMSESIAHRMFTMRCCRLSNTNILQPNESTPPEFCTKARIGSIEVDAKNGNYDEIKMKISIRI